uniref:Shisa N-terminal domain-containing protein n=1 Tax=Amphilophus citrinellus TaxID=61819 RepID=A0A3Q0STJ7_AMPCI
MSSTFVCALTLTFLYPCLCLTENDCFSYLERNDLFHDEQACGRKYCCGECSRRYCCSEKKYQLNQELCPESSFFFRKIAVILGSTIGTIVLVTLCVSVMICCIAPCCLCYKKCLKRPDQRQISKLATVQSIVINSNPSQQPPHPGYQAVPAGPPMPTAPPPSYQEISKLFKYILKHNKYVNL